MKLVGRAYGRTLQRMPTWNSRSIALALGSTVALVGALTGAFVPPRARALLAQTHASASASTAHPPLPYAPPPSRPAALASTMLDLGELHMFSADDGWALRVGDDGRSLVRIRHGGSSLTGVGPSFVVDASFVDANTAFVTTNGVGVGSLVVHRTMDGGATFSAVQIDAAHGAVRSEGLAFRDALRGAVVISDDGGAGSTNLGVWLTGDGGRTWLHDARAPFWWARPVGDRIWVEDENGTILGWNGATLAPIRGLDGCEVEVGFASAPRPDVLRASCETGKRIFVSRDGGASWTEGGGLVPHGDYVFADGEHGFLWTEAGAHGVSELCATSDAGRSWTRFAQAGEWMPIGMVPLSSDDVLVVSRDAPAGSALERLWVSRRRGGLEATGVATDVPTEHILVEVVDRTHVVVVIHGTHGSRILASNDGARTFVQRFAE